MKISKKLYLGIFAILLMAGGCIDKKINQPQNIVPPGEHGQVASPVNVTDEPQGGTVGAVISTVIPRYETSLTAKISSVATSMTLASDPLFTAIGTYLTGPACFTIDEGTTVVEDVCGTASGTAITALTRGISPLTGTSSVASLQFEHRKGASVKITNSPQLIVLSRILNGNEVLPNRISYDSSISTSTFTTYNLVDKDYVDGGFLQGAPTATTTTPGVVQIGTTDQIAAGTGLTGQYTLVAAGSLFSQAWRNATTIPVTSATGTLDSRFIDQTANYAWTGVQSFAGTTTLSGIFSVSSTTASSTYGFGFTHIRTFTASSTWSKPSGVNLVKVRLVGGGGRGGNDAGGGGNTGGGGGGGYCEGIFDVSATSTIAVTVGAPNATSSFSSFCMGGAGQNGTDDANTASNGGVASGGSINITGGKGPITSTLSGPLCLLPTGGSSMLGTGGTFQAGAGSTCNGSPGGLYGGGGTGCYSQSGSCTGGSGANGVVIIEW